MIGFIVTVAAALYFAIAMAALHFVWDCTPDQPFVRSVMLGLTILMALFTGAAGGRLLNDVVRLSALEP